MTPKYDYWRDTLSGKVSSIPVTELLPLPGFYKRKNQDGSWSPVAIWYEHGKCLAKDKGEIVDPVVVWMWCAKHPISEGDYRFYEENGYWQGEARMGDNNPPDENQEIEDQIKEVMAAAEVWLEKNEITSQELADKAAGFQQKLSELSKAAEAKRVEEKKPHLEAGKAVDAKYKKIVNLPKDVIASLKRAVTPFLLAEQKKREAEAEAARIEAAKKIAEAEKIKADAEKKNLTEKEEKVIEEASTATLDAPVKKASVGGNTGRKVTLRTQISGQITDYEKVIMALKDHPEMKDFVQKLCNRAAKAGKELDGMKIKEEQVAV